MSNLVTACEECNLGKSNSSIREAPETPEAPWGPPTVNVPKDVFWK